VGMQGAGYDVPSKFQEAGSVRQLSL
jgi:hypothetical protein